jgi:hypothetical protein
MNRLALQTLAARRVWVQWIRQASQQLAAGTRARTNEYDRYVDTNDPQAMSLIPDLAANR